MDVFNYDGVYRLTDVKYSVPNSDIGDWNNASNIPFDQLAGQRTVEYNMDGVGNRTSVVDDGKVTTYATNSVNEYVYVDNQRLSYDQNGNMTSDGNLRMFYDHNNMLVEIRTPEYIFHGRFDAIGRRLMVQFSDGLTETCYFWYDGQMVIYEEADGYKYRYYNGNLIDEVLCREEQFGQQIWYLTDALGSVYVLTDNNGNIVEAYHYSIYGSPKVYASDGTPRDLTNYDSRILFTSREYVEPLGLYYYRFRWYAPSFGMFIQLDPYILGGGRTYCYGNPVRFTDPWGSQPENKVPAALPPLIAKKIKELWQLRRLFDLVKATAEKYISEIERMIRNLTQWAERLSLWARRDLPKPIKGCLEKQVEILRAMIWRLRNYAFCFRRLAQSFLLVIRKRMTRLMEEIKRWQAENTKLEKIIIPEWVLVRRRLSDRELLQKEMARRRLLEKVEESLDALRFKHTLQPFVERAGARGLDLGEPDNMFPSMDRKLETIRKALGPAASAPVVEEMLRQFRKQMQQEYSDLLEPVPRYEGQWKQVYKERLVKRIPKLPPIPKLPTAEELELPYVPFPQAVPPEEPEK